MYKFHKNSCMNSKPQQVARKTMLEPSVGQCVNPSVFFFFHCVKFHETLCVNIHIARNFVIRAFLMSWRMSLIVFNLPEILISSLWRVFSSSYFFYIFFFGYILTLLNLKFIRIVLLIKTKVQICNLVGSFDVTISWSNACVVKRESNIYMQTYTSVLTFSFILLQKGYKIILNFYFTMNIRLNSQI